MVKPLISINIRTYNSEKTLEDTLKSIEIQTYKKIETIISDGFSTDNTIKIAKKYKARIFSEDKLGDARYQAYKKSKGKYILSLDSDQTMDKALIEECIRVCEKKKLDALTISEKSLIIKGNYLEKLIAYDKWIIDKNRDNDLVFGTACPRFFLKSSLEKIEWPKKLSIFDDTVLYSKLLQNNAKIGYLSKRSIYHHEVNSWIVLCKKFFRYGRGYPKAFSQKPEVIAAHSLPRRSYFTKAAISKPTFFVGLIFLYFHEF